MSNFTRSFLLILTLIAGFRGEVAKASAAEDTAGIRAVISSTYDRADAKVQTDPIVVAGKFALASWTQGDFGGRALMQKRDGVWHIDLCAGDALSTAKGIAEAGVPRTQAEDLAAKLSRAEANVPEVRRRMFNLFGLPESKTYHHQK